MEDEKWSNVKRKYLFVVFLLLLPVLTGCWDSLDIEQRAVVLGIAIDKAEEDAVREEEEIAHIYGNFPVPEKEMIRIYAQIAVPGRIPLGPQTGGGGSDTKPVWVVSVVGHTLDEAMTNLQQEVADELFLGHLRIIVLSEDVAKDGVERFNDYLRRNPEVRRTAWMAVAKGKAERFMKVVPELERIPALSLAAMVENSVSLGKFPEAFLGLFWSILSSKGQDPFLPYLELKEEENVQIKGLAYFKADKMIGITEPIEIGIIMAVQGSKESGSKVFTRIPGTGDAVLVLANKRNSKIRTSLKDGRPHVTMKIHYESEIDENYSYKIDINSNKIIDKIQKEFCKSVEDNILKFTKKVQEDESDIFGFGEYFRAKHAAYWNSEIQTKDNWHSAYKDLTMDVSCTCDIRRVGMKAK